jgi:hypothetical protein
MAMVWLTCSERGVTEPRQTDPAALHSFQVRLQLGPVPRVLSDRARLSVSVGLESVDFVRSEARIRPKYGPKTPDYSRRRRGRAELSQGWARGLLTR